ncbi:MAG: DapH/DapD/GlmU-related protein [Nanobdellota archaeon]
MINEKNYVVGKNVKIGQNVTIGNYVVIHDNVVIKDNVRIDDFTVIGKKPMKAKISATTSNSNEKQEICIIENDSIIGTSVILYAGSKIGKNTMIADQASVRENVEIGANCIIGKNTTIENKVTIGNRCKIQSNVQIVPYSTIEDDVFISPGVITSNDSFAARTKERFSKYKGLTAKKGARIGVAAVVLPGITINEDGFVAAGSVVTKDVPAKKIVMGIPAKVVKDVPDEQLLENQE